MNYRTFACLLLLLSASSAHSASERRPLPVPLAPVLPIEIVLDQKDGPVVTPMVNPLGSEGLIPRLQGAASVKANTPRLAEIKARMVGVDFDGKMEKALRAALASERVSPKSEIHVVREAWSDEDAFAKSQASDGIYLKVNTFYGFDAYFNALRFSVNAWLYKLERTPKGKLKSSVLLARYYDYNISMPDVRWKVANASAWRWQRVSDDDLRAMIDEGIEQTTKMLVYDFSAEGQQDFLNEPGPKSFEWQGAKLKGKLLREEGDRIWVQNSVGSIDGRRVIRNLLQDPATIPH